MNKWILGAGVFTVGVLLGGCASQKPATPAAAAAEARKTDPDWYVKPENSRVPFKLTNSYSFPDPAATGGYVDDIDARDEAVKQASEPAAQ